MNTDSFTRTLKAAQAAREEAQRRRRRNAELRAFLTGGTLVLTGLLLAAIYGLLTQQIVA
jgi:hypothetical protein